MEKFLKLLNKHFPGHQNLSYSEYKNIDNAHENGPFLPRIYSNNYKIKLKNALKSKVI